MVLDLKTVSPNDVESIAIPQKRTRLPATTSSAMSNNSTMASIKKNGGSFIPNFYEKCYLGGEATKQIVTKITDEIYVFVLVEGQ